MKKYSIYTGLFFLGVLVGMFILTYSSSAKNSHEHIEASKDKKELWTCSMHPQIKQTEFGDCPICGMDLIPAEIGDSGLSVNQFKISKNAMALANIQTTVVGNDEGSEEDILLSGKIIENEELNSVQASYFSGRIESLKVNATGEKVSKGQLLATLYAPDLIKAQQELLTAGLLKETQPNLYKAVRNKLKLWKLSENQINQIEKSKRIIENFPIYATVSGTITEKMIDVGDYVKQGQGLFKMSNLAALWGSFDIYEYQIPMFKIGQTLDITSAAYPGETFKAKVSFIDPVIDPDLRVLKLRVNIANTHQKFKIGMFVTGQVKSSNLKTNKRILIPASALLWTGKRSVVYLKLKTDVPVFEMREVILGNKNGNSYEILKGIVPGDEIVTNGTFVVDASAQLQGKKSMMNHVKSIKVAFKTATAFKKQLQKSYNSYIEVKNGFVKTDKDQVTKKVKEFNLNLGKVNIELLKNDRAREEWIKIVKVLKSSSQKIEKSNAIEEQKNQFKILSDHLILAVELFGIQETTYKQFCPMANSDKGAYWLSKEKQILNPYFGDEMLKCGEVKQVINHVN